MSFEINDEVVCISDSFIDDDVKWSIFAGHPFPLKKGKLYRIIGIIPERTKFGNIVFSENGYSIGVVNPVTKAYVYAVGSEPWPTYDIWMEQYFRKIRGLEIKTGLAALIGLSQTEKELVNA